MAENSKIEWTTHTFNPWVGCTKVSPACDHCYAEGWAKRTGQAGLWAGQRRRTSAANWRLPYKWNNAAPLDSRPRVFCASLADVFDNQVPVEWRADLFAMIRETPNLDWLLLTKRPQNIAKMVPDNWGDGYPNVWLGTTVENHAEQRRIVYLRRVPARVRFLSMEPLLEGFIPLLDEIDWVIVGGESGPGARPLDPEWAERIRSYCALTGTAFFMKQMSGVRKPLPPIPPHLMVRQFPHPGQREPVAND